MSSFVSRLTSLSILFTLLACGSPGTTEKTESDDDRLQVVTTFLPVTLFTEAVAGDCANVSSLISPSLGPHDFQASPAELAALGQGSVLVKNGLGIEEFLDDIVSSAGNRDLVVIDSSSGVGTIKSAEGAHTDHSDDEHAHHDHDHGEQGESAIASENEEHGHRHGEFDPHIWLDPLRAVQQVNNIRDGLIAVDPDCAESYKENADLYSAKLKSLNVELDALLKPYKGKTFVAFHDFATYFADRYSLEAEFLVDLPEMNPSPGDLQRVGAQVKASGLKALLSEPQVGNRSFNALAKDLGVNIVEFNPLETGSAESAMRPDTYVEVMRSNVNNLVKAIGN